MGVLRRRLVAHRDPQLLQLLPKLLDIEEELQADLVGVRGGGLSVLVAPRGLHLPLLEALEAALRLMHRLEQISGGLRVLHRHLLRHMVPKVRHQLLRDARLLPERLLELAKGPQDPRHVVAWPAWHRPVRHAVGRSDASHVLEQVRALLQHVAAQNLLDDLRHAANVANGLLHRRKGQPGDLPAQLRHGGRHCAPHLRPDLVAEHFDVVHDHHKLVRRQLGPKSAL
mmetsp:Transcript_65/g.154  ORF Transcript_65/g.154 Transcript_65/m.154 type:complete len:227 (+) Transcript_65:140-820(+)